MKKFGFISLLFFYSSYIQGQFIDFEYWGLFELVQYGTEIYHFKDIDRNIRKVKLEDKRFDAEVIWEYNDGKLQEYRHKGDLFLNQPGATRFFWSKGILDSCESIQNDWVDAFQFQYDSLNRLVKVTGEKLPKKRYKKRDFSSDELFYVNLKYSDSTVIIYDTVGKPFLTDTLLLPALKQSWYRRHIRTKDSLSIDGSELFRSFYGCPRKNESIVFCTAYLPLQECRDTLLGIQVLKYKDGQLVEVIEQSDRSETSRLFLEYDDKKRLLAVYSLDENKRLMLYEFKYTEW